MKTMKNMKEFKFTFSTTKRYNPVTRTVAINSRTPKDALELFIDVYGSRDRLGNSNEKKVKLIKFEESETNKELDINNFIKKDKTDDESQEEEIIVNEKV